MRTNILLPLLLLALFLISCKEDDTPAPVPAFPITVQGIITDANATSSILRADLILDNATIATHQTTDKLIQVELAGTSSITKGSHTISFKVYHPYSPRSYTFSNLKAVVNNSFTYTFPNQTITLATSESLTLSITY